MFNFTVVLLILAMNVVIYMGVGCVIYHNSPNTAPFVEVKFGG